LVTLYCLQPNRDEVGLGGALLKRGAGVVRDDDSGEQVLGPHGPHNATDAEVVEASRAANAHHFIAGLPEGYET
jgi:hypothetical protein